MPRIPRELTTRPFSLDEARAAGLTLSALRGQAWLRLGSRLYCWRGAASNEGWALLYACHRMLPSEAVFVGRTAAWMHRLNVKVANPVEVAVPMDCNLRSRAGLEVHHSAVTLSETISIRGLRATTLDRTLIDLCARSETVEALIALDMAVHGKLTNREKLHHSADRTHGRPGAARLRSLAEYAAPAESPMETRLRWLLIQAGLPRPEAQTDLHDESGRFVGRADLFYPVARLVIEFDGGNHRERLVSDDRRQNLLTTAGYRVLRFTTPDVYQRPELIEEQVRGALVASKVVRSPRRLDRPR